MKESFSAEHSGKLFTNSLEQLLNGCRISDKSGGHFEPLWWDITNSGFDIIWNPFDKIRRIFILNIHHLLVYVFHAHFTTEHRSHSQIAKFVKLNFQTFEKIK